MKPAKGKYLVTIFVIAVASTTNIRAQEFRGFYGTNDQSKNDPSSRSYRPARSANKNSAYTSLNNDAVGDQPNSYYSDGYSYPSSIENRSAYPAANLTINIFSADYKPLPATSRNYNRNYSSDLYYDNRGYYPPNTSKVSAGTKTIKINGSRFYEMNGNYYKADLFGNPDLPAYQTNQLGETYNVVKGQQARNSVYLPAANEGGNYGNYDYVVDDYNSGYNTYNGKRRVDNTVSALQKEQKALQEENSALKQQLNEQQAILVEQKRRLQMVSDLNVAKGQQEAQKEDIKRSEANRNSVSDSSALYSNINIGDTVDQIPKNSKIITIDGRKTYISPGNVYYQQQKNSKFTVVGMEKK